MDMTDPTDANPEARLLHISGWTILMLHIVGVPAKADPAAATLIQEHAPDIVVFGHSHKVCVVQHDGILYVNPGSAGTLSCQGHTCCCTRGCCHSCTCTCLCIYMLLLLWCWMHVPTKHQVCIDCCLGIAKICEFARDRRFAAAIKATFKRVHTLQLIRSMMFSNVFHTVRQALVSM